MFGRSGETNMTDTYDSFVFDLGTIWRTSFEKSLKKQRTEFDTIDAEALILLTTFQLR